jgi:hypothetical protein
VIFILCFCAFRASLPRTPNQRAPSGEGSVQHIFSAPSRFWRPISSAAVPDRDATLKMLFIMENQRREIVTLIHARSFRGKMIRGPRGNRENIARTLSEGLQPNLAHAP